MAAMAAAMKEDLKDVIDVDIEDYLRATYGAVSLADAVRQLLPDAHVTVVKGTGVVPSQPTDIPAAVAAAREADAVILAVGGQSAWFGNEVTEGEGKDTANIDLPPRGEARASLTLTNSGRRRGTEVVQLYAADTATGVTLPAQQLVGFARVDLEPGASKTVTFAVPMSVLGYTGLSGE